MSNRCIEKYLRTHTDFQRWPLDCHSLDGIEQVVVIPSLAEYPTLFDTLADLAKNPIEELARTLVLCVVNNASASHSEPKDVENNRQTLEHLEEMRSRSPELRLAYVDASSPGREIPGKGVSVGHERSGWTGGFRS